MSIFNVERDAIPVGLLGNQSTTLTVVSGDTLYYADNSQVSPTNNQGSLASGGSATFTNNVWIVSASASSVSQTFTAASSGGSSVAGSSFPTWIDICNPPSGSGITAVAQGGDPTSALQAAINYANTNNIDVDIYWSKPVGTVAGAVRSGSGTISAKAYSYAGQIVFPARALTSGTITIRIKGLVSIPNFYYGPYPQPAGGAELVSSLATASASVFDAIPATYPGFGNNAFTAISAVFDNVDIRCPADPQCNGIDGNNLLDLSVTGSSRISTTATSQGTNTGTGFGIRFPPFGNGGVARQSGSFEVNAFPTGIIHDEHFTAELLMLEGCKVGIAPTSSGNGHTSFYGRAIFQGCQVDIQPSGGTTVPISGRIDIGDVTPYTNLWVVNDASNLLYGELVVGEFASGGVSRGFPVNGGRNLTFTPWNGRRYQLPSDTFGTVGNLAGSNFAGATDNTHDLWIPWDNNGKVAGAQTNWSRTGGVFKMSGTGTTWPMAFLQSRIGRAGASRVVRVILTTGTSYTVYIPIGFVISGTNANNMLYVALVHGLVNGSADTVSLSKQVSGTDTTLCQSAASAVAISTTYTVDVIINNPRGSGTPTIRVLFGSGDARSTAVTFTDALTVAEAGTGTLSGGVYTLSATEAGQIADTNQTDCRDGVGFFSDTGSSFLSVAVMPN